MKIFFNKIVSQIITIIFLTQGVVLPYAEKDLLSPSSPFNPEGRNKGIPSEHSISDVLKLRKEHRARIKWFIGIQDWNIQLVKNGTINNDYKDNISAAVPFLSANGRRFLAEQSITVMMYKDYDSPFHKKGKAFLLANPKEFDTAVVGQALWKKIQDIPEALAECINAYAEWYYDCPSSCGPLAEIEFVEKLETPLLDEIFLGIRVEAKASAISFAYAISKLVETNKDTRTSLEEIKSAIMEFIGEYLKSPGRSSAKAAAHKILAEETVSLNLLHLVNEMYISFLRSLTDEDFRTTLKYLRTLNSIRSLAILTLRSYNLILDNLSDELSACDLYTATSEIFESSLKLECFLYEFPFRSGDKEIVTIAMLPICNALEKIKDMLIRTSGHNPQIFDTGISNDPKSVTMTKDMMTLHTLADFGACGYIVEHVESAQDGSELLDTNKPVVALACGMNSNDLALLDTARRRYPQVNWILCPLAVSSTDGTYLGTARRNNFMFFYNQEGKLTYAKLGHPPTVDSIMLHPEGPMPEGEIAVVNSNFAESIARSKIKTCSIIGNKDYLPQTLAVEPSPAISINERRKIASFVRRLGNQAVVKSDSGARAEGVYMVRSPEEAIEKAEMYADRGFVVQERILPPRFVNGDVNQDWVIRAFVELMPDGTTKVTGIVVKTYANGEALVEDEYFLLEDILRNLHGVSLPEEQRRQIKSDIEAVGLDVFKSLKKHVAANCPKPKHLYKSCAAAGPTFISIDLILDARDIKPKVLEINGANSGRIQGLRELLPKEDFEVGTGFLGILAKDAATAFTKRTQDNAQGITSRVDNTSTSREVEEAYYTRLADEVEQNIITALGINEDQLFRSAAEVGGQTYKFTQYKNRKREDVPYFRAGPFIVIQNKYLPKLDPDSINYPFLIVTNYKGFRANFDYEKGFTKYTIGVLLSIWAYRDCVKDSPFIDIGAGRSGVFGIAASKLGASEVIFIDKEDDVVTELRGSIAINNVPKYKIFASDILDIRGMGPECVEPNPRFPVLALNLPFYGTANEALDSALEFTDKLQLAIISGGAHPADSSPEAVEDTARETLAKFGSKITDECLIPKESGSKELPYRRYKTIVGISLMGENHCFEQARDKIRSLNTPFGDISAAFPGFETANDMAV